MKRISKEQLARNLEELTGIEDGKEGLNTLIYGWLRFRKYGKKYRHVVNVRKTLYITEVVELSEYAGVDLAQKS